MSFFLVVNLAVMMRELTGSQLMSAPYAPVSHPQYGRLHPGCVLSTAVVLYMKVSAVLIVVTLSHPVPALRSCSFSSLLLLGWFFSCLTHHPDVPRGYSRCCPGCQKGSQPCNFLSAFTALHHKSPRWRPFLTQVNVLISCCICFRNLSFFLTSRVVSPTQTPLSSRRVGPALVASYNMCGRAVGLFYTQPTGHQGEAAVKSLKKGKSAGVDNITLELVPAGGETMIDIYSISAIRSGGLESDQHHGRIP